MDFLQEDKDLPAAVSMLVRSAALTGRVRGRASLPIPSELQHLNLSCFSKYLGTKSLA